MPKAKTTKINKKIEFEIGDNSIAYEAHSLKIQPGVLAWIKIRLMMVWAVLTSSAIAVTTNNKSLVRIRCNQLKQAQLMLNLINTAETLGFKVKERDVSKYFESLINK